MKHLPLLACLSLLAVTSPTLAATQEGTDISPVQLQRVDPVPRLAVDDEISDLEAKLKPAARFADYTPDWRVDQRTFTFAYYQKTKTKRYQVVWDGDKAVAVVRSGYILLLARTPDDAKAAIGMPTERMHLDNLIGSMFATHQFIQKTQTHGSVQLSREDTKLGDGWEASATHLTLVRKQSQEKRDVEARFTFTVDPVFGYRIDAQREVVFKSGYKPGKVSMGFATFTPGCYPPWQERRIYDRTAWTTIEGGITGWANNLLTMDRCDANKSAFAWRDRGFVSYLTTRDGWGRVYTRADGTGDTPSLALCNAHNDIHIKLVLKDLPQRDDGAHVFRATHRIMALPPEMSAHVWDHTQLIQRSAKSLIVKIGAVEDFEDQPVALTEPARGLVWTARHPEIVEGVAHSGDHSIKFTGRSWPNLPQVSLKPNTKYVLEGWFKVEPWTDEEWDAAKRKDARRREKLAEKGKTLPAQIDWDAAKRDAKAYIRGDFYEWSPHTGEMVVKQTTTHATPDKDGWQYVKLDIDSPDWGPAINIVLHADHCTAYLDDFALREVTE